MSSWWASQLDYVYFVYGLSSVVMGAVLWGLHRRARTMPWQWLSWYGLLHGTGEWLDIVSLSFDDKRGYATIGVVLLAASYLCLLEFGRLGIRALGGRAPGRWICLPLLMIAGLGGLHGNSGIDAALRYALGIPGGLASAVVLWRYAERELPSRRILRTLAALMALYALGTLCVPAASFFPASRLNREAFSALTGLPIQVVRGGIVACLAIGFWWYGESARNTHPSIESRSWLHRELLLGAAVVLVLVTGWFATGWVGGTAIAEITGWQLDHTRTIAATLPQEWLAAAPGPGVRAEPNLRRLAAQLGALRQSCSVPGYYQLVRQTPGDFVLLAEAGAGLPAVPSAESVCPELEPGIRAVFRTQAPTIVGPHQKRIGLCYTTAAPVLSAQGELLAVVVVDMPAGPVLETAARERLVPIAGSFLASTLLLLFFVVRRHTRGTDELLRRLSRAVEQSPVSIVITDTQGHIEYVNPKFTQVTGYTPDEACGQNPSILKAGTMPEEGYKQLWETITAGHEWRGEFHNRKKNGEHFWESASISPVFDNCGRITHYVAVKEDITERKRVDAHLQRSLSLLEATLESTADGILVTDSEGRIARANHKFAELWSIPEDVIARRDHVTMRNYVIAQVANVPQFVARWRDIKNDPNAVSLDEIILSDRRVFEWYSQPEILEGAVVGRVWSFRDVTDVKRLLNEQRVNIDIARQLLRFVDVDMPRFVDFDPERFLFIEPISVSCNASGGDHYFARVLSDDAGQPQRTVISLKDQSGHEVNCTLRSIATDLIHHALLSELEGQDLRQQMKRLNNQLCNSGLLGEDDFLTAITLEIDHASRIMRYAACGHPPLVLIRGTKVLFLPQQGHPGSSLPLGAIPEAAYSTGEWKLEDGDRILLYTDGLIEMPVRTRGRRLTQAEFEKILADIVAPDPQMPVSSIMRRLLQVVAELSGESSFPGELARMTDDVSLIGLELQHESQGKQVLLHPADLDAVSDEIEKLFATIAEEWTAAGFSNPDRRLRVVLEEAILNAWKHGHVRQMHKPIAVRWHHHNDFVVEVVDRGEGFDPGSLPDPRSFSRRLATDGRGIFMIKAASDSVRWKSGGRHIVASFANPTLPRGRTRGGFISRTPLWRIPGGKDVKPWN